MDSITLYRSGHKYVITYDPNDMDEFMCRLRCLVDNAKLAFDSFDAQIIAHKAGGSYSEYMKGRE